jgi:hypothetical protein
LDANDASEYDESKPLPESVIEAIKRLSDKKEKLTVWLKELEKGEVKEISTVDPDAHIMRQGGDGRAKDACYNVRTVVDSKNKLIVDFENSTCANDIGSLARPVENAKEVMGVSKIAVVADSGFYDGADFERCKESNTICYTVKLRRGTKAPSEEYSHSCFKYDNVSDIYICPQGAVLPFKYNKRKNELSGRVYGNIDACRACRQRGLCTKHKRGWREILRSPYQDAEDEVDARMATDDGRRIMGERKKIVEHPYGTIKKIWGFGCFLCRGLEKTTGEASLAFLAFNLRRAYNIFKENGENILENMAH